MYFLRMWKDRKILDESFTAAISSKWMCNLPYCVCQSVVLCVCFYVQDYCRLLEITEWFTEWCMCDYMIMCVYVVVGDWRLCWTAWKTKSYLEEKQVHVGPIHMTIVSLYGLYIHAGFYCSCWVRSAHVCVCLRHVSNQDTLLIRTPH